MPSLAPSRAASNVVLLLYYAVASFRFSSLRGGKKIYIYLAKSSQIIRPESQEDFHALILI